MRELPEWWNDALRAAQQGHTVPDGPSGLQILAGVGIFALGYVFLGGVFWALVRAMYDDIPPGDEAFMRSLWPLMLIGWLIYQIAMAGPNVAKLIGAWRKKARLPKATLVQR
jgi:hypothetical protein